MPVRDWKTRKLETGRIMVKRCGLFLAAAVAAICLGGGMHGFPEEAVKRAEKGTHKYEAFEPSEKCAACHKQISIQYQQSAMAKAQALPWDQAEYFQFALPHTRIETKVAPVEAGCINCHAPQAFLAGDVPPPPAGKADPKADGVSCDLCHAIVGFDGDAPANGNFAVSPGKIKHGSREDAKPMGHESRRSAFYKSAELCGTYHDESSPYGAWVKETYREWKEGPYARNNMVCLNCHVPPAPGKAATMGKERPDVAQHLFQGAYSQTMLNGAATLVLYPLGGGVRAGSSLEVMAVVTNNRAGHRIPTGSTEERQLWLRLELRDAGGKVHHIPAPLAPGDSADKGYSVTSNRPAYRDLGDMMGLKDFKGIARDSLPEGDRLYRKVFLNPRGEETIAQWYAEKTDVFDNRLKPMEAVVEQYAWTVPADILKGKATITATLNYRRLPQSVADLVKIGEVPILRVAKSEAVVEIR